MEEVRAVVLDGISNNMAAAVKVGGYAAMSTGAGCGYYIVKFLSEPYALQASI